MLKHVVRHLRLLISALVGATLYFLLPHDWPGLTRLLVSWNVGVLLFLTLAFHLMFALNSQQLTEHYKDEDEAAGLILVISVLGAILALVAIVVFLSSLSDVRRSEKALYLGLAALTVISTWVLMPTMFTLHYADMYYSAEAQNRPLYFPDKREPVFWDFVYFSFTIAAACQTADVATGPGSIRKVVIVHSVLSFFFNASILGFAINVTAGLIGKVCFRAHG